MAPGDVPRMQQLIAAVNSELRDGESEESAAKHVLEMATSKPPTTLLTGHYETGEPLPDEFYDKLKGSKRNRTPVPTQ